MWTQFWDMHSGGGCKENWSKIYIEASEDEARTIFYNRFGHSPSRVSCTCCGEDYSVDCNESLQELTQFHCEQRGLTLEQYLKDDDVLVIRAEDIKPGEREGDVPEQGYVWVD